MAGWVRAPEAVDPFPEPLFTLFDRLTVLLFEAPPVLRTLVVVFAGPDRAAVAGAT
jgi:hypothetical protein